MISTETMSNSLNDLPDDVLSDVLLTRLSWKSLARSFCVEKSWHKRSARIKELWHNRRKYSDCSGVVIFACYAWYLKPTLYSIDLDKILTLRSINLDESCDNDAKKQIQLPPDSSGSVQLRRYKILGTCYGLLCLGLRSAEVPLSRIIFPDPLKKKLWDLPSPPFRSEGRGYFYEYGFGYDEASDEYKLVVLGEIDISDCGRENITSLDVFLYNLKSRSWKKLPIDQAFTTYMPGNGVFSNNAVHWLMRDSSVLGNAHPAADGTEDFVKPPT